MTDNDTPPPTPPTEAAGPSKEMLERVEIEEGAPEATEHEHAPAIDLSEIFGFNPNVGVDPANSAAQLEGAVAEPGGQKPDPILVVDNVSRSFGGLKAVDVAHLEIQRGVITALIGPNGAGKTTFFNLLTNFDKPDTGSRLFRPLTATPLGPVADDEDAADEAGDKNDSESTESSSAPTPYVHDDEHIVHDGMTYKVTEQTHDLGGVPSYKVAELGMVRTFQLTKALSKMTCIENMRLGATHQRGESMLGGLLTFPWTRQERQITHAADGLLRRFRMDHMRDDFAGTLSGGQRKLLEMARALMVQPKLVMLDEPMAGVNPALTESLLGHITSLRDSGMTVVFVEHDMDMVQSIADWVVVMAEGRIIAEGTPAAIAENQEVVDAYLGSAHGAPLDLDKEL